MASHTFWTLCANLVDGRVAFIQRNLSFLKEGIKGLREVRL